jgi:hypothetical protein
MLSKPLRRDAKGHDMALKAAVTREELSALPEPIQQEYVENNGKYILSVAPVGGLDLQDVTGLRTALEQERQNVKALNALKAKFGDMDPDAAREAMTIAEQFKSGKLDDKQKAVLDARLKEVTEKHNGELSKQQARTQKLASLLQREMVESRAATLLAEKELGGNPTLLMPHILREAKVVEDGDDFRVSVIDPVTGHERISTSKEYMGKPMSLKELLVDMRNRQALMAAFHAPDASGTGSRQNAGVGGTRGAHTISAAEAKDPVRYRAAKDAATKAGVSLEII